MKCIICNSASHYYFSKTYTEKPYDEFMRDIGEIHYYRCEHCGFVLSKTHSDLEQGRWNKLNYQCHHDAENPESEKKNNAPPYAEQSMMLVLLGKNGIISTESMIDYAAGYGTLSNILAKYHGLTLPIFDPYVQAGDAGRYVDGKELGVYRTVINSAMFEHVRCREDLDAVQRLVDGNGALILHTVVCERVPPDPNWFYLRPPVHTAFHTNKSMEILMRQWGYHSSIYCPPSKCWVLLKGNVANLEQSLDSINQELQSPWFHFKEGFVDYWKGF